MSNRTLRVLIVDPSEDHALQLSRVLKKGGYRLTMQRIETLSQLRQLLEEETWDVVLANPETPALPIKDLLERLRFSGRDTPCVIVSATENETSAQDLMTLGAQDFIRYSDLSRLVPAVRRELQQVSVREDRLRAQETLQHRTRFDSLTNLPNRTTFLDRLTLALAHAARERKMLAVVFVDLDRFKTIVDTLGHNVGDQLLRQVADRLTGCLYEGDSLARMGGDEFVILLPLIERADKAVALAQRAIDSLQPAFKLGGHELHVTLSMGISLFPYDGEDAETLLKNADTALYRAKEQGRNNYQLYTPAMNARAFERLAMENSLRRALERNEFQLYYQPQIDAKTGLIAGVEALLRWKHPDLGLVYPSEFIGLAEETGLIVPIGTWVLRTACEQNKAWQKSGFPPITVAVNLSGRQFQDHALMETISTILHDTHLDPRWLEVEITESIAMQNADYTHVILRDLKARDIQVSVDDFGTGYSSLSYLKKFPIDTLKIDQSFVRDLSSDPNDAAIANAVIVLAHSLHLNVVAEGVETKEQEEFLREHQCDRLQGYLFSEPVPADQIELFWRKQQQQIPKTA